MIVDSFPVTYPYPTITADQETIITQALRGLRQTLDGRRVISLIEAPTGAGKTLSMLSAISAFKTRYPNAVSKVLFLCRTVNEVNHVLGEAHKLNRALQLEADAAARAAHVSSATGDSPDPESAPTHSSQFLAIPLTSRLRFCVNEAVTSNASGFTSTDSLCHLCTTSLTADIEDMGLEGGLGGSADSAGIPPCRYYQNTLSTPVASAFPPSAFTIPEFQRACKDRGLCPYFASRNLVEVADLIVCAYNYILDPKFSPAISQYLDDRTVILFDEAHNLEFATTDAYSMSMSYSMVESCKRQLLSKLGWVQKRLERNSLRPIKVVADSTGMDPGGPRPNLEINSEMLRRSILRNPKAINSVERDANVLFNTSVSLSYLDGVDAPFGNALLGGASSANEVDVEISPVHFFNALLRFCHYLTTSMLRMARSNSDNLLLHPKQEMVSIMENYGLTKNLLQAAPEILHSYMHGLGFISMDLAHLAQFASLFAYSTELGDTQNSNLKLSQLLGESFIFLIERPDILSQTRTPEQLKVAQGDGQGAGIFGGATGAFVQQADRVSKGGVQEPNAPAEGPPMVSSVQRGARLPEGNASGAAGTAGTAAPPSLTANGATAGATNQVGDPSTSLGNRQWQGAPGGSQRPQGQESRILTQTSRVFEDGVFSTKPSAWTAMYRIICLNSFLALQPLLQYFRLIFMMSGTLQLGELSSRTVVDGVETLNTANAGAPSPPQQMGNEGPASSGPEGRPTASVFERILGLDYYASLCPPEMIPAIHRMSVSSDLLGRNAYVKFLTKGSDLSRLTTRYLFRSSLSVVQNYARLIQLLANSYSDGMVVFFPSYRYMEDLLVLWRESNLLQSLVGNKLLFLETPDPVETTHAVAAYKIACDLGRGAVFFGVARGKVSEGVDFKGPHGRICLLVGVPYSYSGSALVQVRLAYLSRQRNVSEREYLQADAGRVASQCVGRVLRGSGDFAAVLLADYRYEELRPYLSGWLQASLTGDGGKKVEVLVQELRDKLYGREKDGLFLEKWRRSEGRV